MSADVRQEAKDARLDLDLALLNVRTVMGALESHASIDVMAIGECRHHAELLRFAIEKIIAVGSDIERLARRVDSSAIEATEGGDADCNRVPAGQHCQILPGVSPAPSTDSSSEGGGPSHTTRSRSGVPAESTQGSAAPPVALADAIRELADQAEGWVTGTYDEQEENAHAVARRLRALAAEAERPRFTPEEREALQDAIECLDGRMNRSYTNQPRRWEMAAVLRAMLSSAEGRAEEGR